jgi:hypothetical protein
MRALDLDALAPRVAHVTISGNEYEVVEPDLQEFGEIMRIVAEHEIGTGDERVFGPKQQEGIVKVSMRLVPTLPEDVIRSLGLRQILALQKLFGEFLSFGDAQGE